MIRIVHAADLHLGTVRYGRTTATGNSRLEDFAATLDRIVGEAIAERADALVLAGDTFDNRHERPEERAVLARSLARLADAGIDTIIVDGNHDGKRVIGDPTSASLRWLEALRIPSVHALLEPGVASMVVGQEGKRLVVTALPYPHKRSFDRALADVPPEDRVVEAGRRLDSAIRVALTPRDTGDDPCLFVGHLTVAGSRTGSERLMRFEDDVVISAEALAGFDYAALGHIHRQQQVAPNAWYAGAPEYIDFGEQGLPKGVLVVDIEHGKAPVVRSRPIDVRRMLTIEATPSLAAEAHQLPDASIIREPGGRLWDLTPRPDALDGAMVRLRVPAGTRPASTEAIRRAILDAGASFVKADPVQQEVTRVDRPAAHAGLDLLAATRLHLEAKGVPPGQVETALIEAASITFAVQ